MSKATTSWADETDDLDEPIHKPKEPQSNPWNKGNPLVATKPAPVESKDNRDSEFPEVKSNFNEKGRETKRFEGNSKEGRNFKGEEQQQNHPQRDYHQRDNFNRDNRPREGFGGRDNSHQRDNFNRENGIERENRGGGGFDRENRGYGGRNYEDRRGGGGGGGGYNRDRSRNDKPREPREPVPFPTEPPFTAYVGNLSFNVVEDDLYSFFGAECKVNNVRLLSNKENNRPKGFGYVEFGDLDSLKRAVAKNGEPFLERPLRIDVAEAKPEEKQQSGGWNRSFDRPAKSFSQPNYSNSEFSRNREESSSDQPPKERPKLDLKPRSETTPKPIDEADTSYASSKSNPFGEAKPRDENAFLKKKEEGEDPNTTSETTKSPEETKSTQKPSPRHTEKEVGGYRHSENNKGDFSRGDSSQRRDDNKSRRPPRNDREKHDKGGDMNKPFVRGSGSGQGARPNKPFKKDEKNGRSDKPRPQREERRDREKVPEQLKQLPDVRSTNLFSALDEEQE